MLGQNIPPPPDDGTSLALIKAGVVWRYFDRGGLEGSAWRSVTFDDSQWGTGPAQLGYGDGDEATVLSSGPDPTQKSITTYFRRAFDLADAAQVTQLTLRLLRDDGAVVYLNGQEVARHNMPAGPVSAQTLAASAAGADENEFHEFVLAPTGLVNGGNVVSVEVHQVNVSSTDLSFDLELHAKQAPGNLPVVSLTALGSTLEFCPPPASCAPIMFLLRRTGPALDQPLTVSLRYGGTATAGVDYPALPTQVTFKAGEDRTSVSSAPIDDALHEGDETIVADLVARIAYSINPQQRQATTVLQDNEAPAPPVVSLELVDPKAMETLITQNNIDWAEFRVLRTGPVTDGLVVFLNTAQGTARLGEDYRLDGVSDASTVRFQPGERSVNVRLYPTDDDFYEGEEGVFFHLIAAPAVADTYQIDFAHSSVAMVIHDNDPVTTRLDITSPRDGQHFEAGEVIPLRTQVIGPDNGGIWTVEFFDGDRRIGTAPAGGTLWWSDAIGGPHVITARASNAAGTALQSRPVTISVGPGPAWPVVGIVATGPRTGEPCPVCFVAPGMFTVSRTGPTTESLKVYLEHDGPATPGTDYVALPPHVTIPVGQKSIDILVMGIDDLIPEGPEIVRTRIVSPELATLGYVVSAFANETMVVIFDDEAGAPKIRLDLVEPEDGAHFALGTTIHVSALGVWTEGELDRPVQFFAGNVFIGQSDPPQLGRPTIPGLPSVHTIVWTNPFVGRHVLTARFESAPGAAVTSPPVTITVGSDPALPTVSLGADDDFASEISILAVIDPARFRVSRTGDLSQDLLVFYSLHGSATAGVDYQAPSGSIRIPPGQASATFDVVPKFDQLQEGMETVVIRLQPSPVMNALPSYDINPSGRDAVAVILDNGSFRTPGIEIVMPEEGDNFPVPASVEIVVAAYHPTHDIYRVEFYAGATKIGESAVDLDRAFSGGLIVHRFIWNNPPAGTHLLTARGFDGTADPPLTSRAVRITAGADPPAPVISIEATQPIAEESSFPFRRLALRGEFTISRTGPVTDSLPVFVLFSGMATSGADYPHPPVLVTIPAGAASTSFHIVPNDDGVPEGLETVVATVVDCLPCPFPNNVLCTTPCLNFQVDPAHESATVFIRDDGITEASLSITRPTEGANFMPGAPILIEAIAIDLESYIGRVEFWDGEQKIGESEIVFIRAPDPGTPIHHSFDWRNAAPGSHKLTARVINADGSVLSSPPVQVTVGPGADRVVLEIEATDPVATEGGANGPANAAADPAVFTVRRIAGPRDIDVTVLYSVEGTARNGVDYAELRGDILLPAGADTVQLVVKPIPDQAIEGDETVIIRLEPPICIAIAPPPPGCYLIGSKAEAKAIISERGPNQAPIVAITRPAAGSSLPAETPIEIAAETRDPDGYVTKVEFFADGRKIGEAGMEFLHAPDPGQSQIFTFVWRQSTPGPHTLTARAIDNNAAAGNSAPVGIKVGISDSLPTVTVTPFDSFAVEPRANLDPNTATFRIHRFGPSGDALVVAYSLGGTAKNGVDYGELSGLATVPAGERSVDVIVRPLADAVSEGVETVVLELEQPPLPTPEIRVINPYRVGLPNAAAVVISDVSLAPSPGAAQCVAMPGNLLHLCFAAETGQNYRVEASRDLRNWETLSEAVSSDDAWHFVDTEMSNHPFRFYRLAPELVAGGGE